MSTFRKLPLRRTLAPAAADEARGQRACPLTARCGRYHEASGGVVAGMVGEAHGATNGGRTFGWVGPSMTRMAGPVAALGGHGLAFASARRSAACGRGANGWPVLTGRAPRRASDRLRLGGGVGAIRQGRTPPSG